MKAATPPPARTAPSDDLDRWYQRLVEEPSSALRRELDASAPAMIAPLVSRLLDATAGAEPESAAIYALAAFGDEPAAVERLIALASHDDDDVRATAVGMLAFLEPRADDAVFPTLLRALSDDEPDVHRAAAEGLGQLARAEALEPLFSALARARSAGRPDALFIGNLLGALAACGPGRDDVVDALVAQLAAADRYATLPAFKALVSMGPPAARAIPALEALTAGDDPYREMHARHALAVITGDATPHLVRLRAGLGIPDGGGAVSASAKLALDDLRRRGFSV
jgi:HEAT repeat protein